jgi:Protein of unknown function (DUF3489)
MTKKTAITKIKPKGHRKAKGNKTGPVPRGRTGTKKEQLVTMLRQGATVEALTKALTWQPHTLRAAISGLNKAGMKVERERAEGITSYKISA